MTIRRVLCSLVVLLVAGAAAGCGSSSDADAGSDADQASTTSSTAGPTKKGEPISEPVCDFVGISTDNASGLLNTEVTATSDVGDEDPGGGSCALTPTTGAEAVVTIAVFPDTEESFDSYIRRFTTKVGPSGRLLWTAPVELSGIGDLAYSFKSPDGGYDNVWVFVNGYRVLVSDRNTSSAPLGAEAVLSIAEEAASNL